jgi:enamine deaminase RidA (YjgF/YER057c/UK114 family)
MTARVVNPEGFAKPVGYSNGMVASGAALYVAGQVGWEADGTFKSNDLAVQFGRALDHVVSVVKAAGGKPEDVVQMTVYVTDMDAYREHRREIGLAWQRRFGKHYPAMALVGVKELVPDRALVEISAIAHLGAAS